MAWDTEATRTKLLDAGARQFARAGFAGARMDAIGRDAGVNKERVYRYFGDKQGLFSAVLTRELTDLLTGIDVTGTGPERVGEFAGRLYDRCRRRPELPRLLAWESLELDHAASPDSRRPMCTRNWSGIRSALPDVSEADAQGLLLAVISLVVSHWTLGALRDVIPADPDPDRHRAMLITQCTGMATATAAAAMADSTGTTPRPR
ncbi:TetR/AcrR family transcriptional regulator [Gordonia sp. VNQ95]|jgi:AcrR family transcriptional regulator|uniref:TetR/AcrR family transcriptional regulator n=1 Tax=Gordonia TaxID=2053 RepID=UPI0032B62612